MDINKLQTATTNFRLAIDAIYNLLGDAFKSFPAGSCGDTTLMLGTYLIEQGLGEFQYMQGIYYSETEKNWISHAWLQAGDIVVDITADQFPEMTNPAIVQENSEWHARLNGEAENLGDYRIYDHQTVSYLGKLYAKIIIEINRVRHD